VENDASAKYRLTQKMNRCQYFTDIMTRLVVVGSLTVTNTNLLQSFWVQRCGKSVSIWTSCGTFLDSQWPFGPFLCQPVLLIMQQTLFMWSVHYPKLHSTFSCFLILMLPFLYFNRGYTLPWFYFSSAGLLWPPYEIGGPLYFCPVVTIFLSIFFSSPNLSGRRLDVYHTSTHGVALVRI